MKKNLILMLKNSDNIKKYGKHLLVMQTQILVVVKFHDVNALKCHHAAPPETLSKSVNE